MQTFRRTDQRGFITLVIIIIIALIILGYLGLNIRDILDNPSVQDNLSYFWDFVVHIWNDYLSVPFHWVWDHILSVLWDLFLQGVEGLRDGTSTTPPPTPGIGGL